MSAILSRPHCDILYEEIYVRGSCLVVFGCGLVPIGFVHIFQGYFSGTEQLPQGHWSKPEWYESIDKYTYSCKSMKRESPGGL